MGQPRPTHRMYGNFQDDARLPKEIRGQNLFYTTEEDYLYCMAVGKAVRRAEADALRDRGLIVQEEQNLKSTLRRGRRKSLIRDRGLVILLGLGCLLMLAANLYAVLTR